MDSKMRKLWSIESAQDAIKAAFFSRLILASSDPKNDWLHFSQIRAIISNSEGKIGDRTLSRALKRLLDMGQIKQRREGKYSFYCLVISKPDMTKAFARAESSSLETAGAIGGWGEATEGWALFGVPETIPLKFRSRFRTMCKLHQKELRETLLDLWDECTDSILKPARNKVPRSVFLAGERALIRLFDYQLLGMEGISNASRIWKLIENAAPGTLSASRKLLGLNPQVKTPLEEVIALTTARIANKDLREVRSEVEMELRRFLKEIQSALDAFKPIWEVLSPRQKERASQMLGAVSQMTASITSVVHP